ncbi:MAG TPA: hypothetical protein VHY37_05030 [Tepidisphaeraceae bacterium]|jgi:hypothetical protein|nr:hypothetical protein [Tepidisphaeraceae bacterium]
MTREELFAIWAPAKSAWTPWAKAVVFAHWGESLTSPVADAGAADAFWLPQPQAQTAIVVDLPGAAGVVYAIRLASLGYRPVPLYSAAPWPRRAPLAPYGGTSAALVDVASILDALVAGAAQLASAHLPPGAPPAFMLDANRQVGARPAGPGDFDNRSISLPTDFPSAAMLARHGIGRALLLQSHGLKPPADLIHTLGRWTGNGIEMLCRPLDATGEPEAIRVKPPGPIARFFHGLFATAGFRRNSLGGFGGIVSAAGG